MATKPEKILPGQIWYHTRWFETLYLVLDEEEILHNIILSKRDHVIGNKNGKDLLDSLVKHGTYLGEMDTFAEKLQDYVDNIIDKQ